MVYTIIIIIMSLADQIIKAVVNRDIMPGERLVVIDGFFYLVNRKNPGAAWSFLAEPDWGIYFLSIVSAVITVFLLVAIYRISHKGLKLALSLITAGSIGNLVDRVRIGAVTDYLDFHFGRYVFPTFNLADSLIVIGTGLLIVLILTRHHLLDEPMLPWQKAVKGDDTSDTENITENSYNVVLNHCDSVPEKSVCRQADSPATLIGKDHDHAENSDS